MNVYKTSRFHKKKLYIRFIIYFYKIWSFTFGFRYQAPGDCGKFPKKEEVLESKSTKNIDNILCSDTEQLVVKNLHIGQKRNNEINSAKLPSKKCKK